MDKDHQAHDETPTAAPVLARANHIAGYAATGNVWIDGDQLPLEPSREIHDHSPTGFAWGYGGSGPAQLALAILLHVCKDHVIADRYYQSFKWDIISKLDCGKDFDLCLDVSAWIQRNIDFDKEHNLF